MLTGRTRLRVDKKLFRGYTLVVQVEVKGPVFSNDGLGVDVREETRWVDAKLDDVEITGLGGKEKC